MVPNHNHKSSVLFEFDTLFDIDLAIVRLIQDKYNNKNIFHEHILNGDEYFIKCMLFLNEEQNPIHVLLKDEHNTKANADSILMDIYKKHELELYEKYCTPFSIFDMMKLYRLNTDNLIDVYVYCKTDIQKQVMSCIKIQNGVNIISVKDRKDINISIIDNIYVKKFESILEYNMGLLKAKVVTFLRYNYNLESDHKTPIVCISTLIGGINKVRIVIPYSDFEFPDDEYNEKTKIQEEETK